MSIDEYFGDWCKVIDTSEINKTAKALTVYKTPVRPEMLFRIFRWCEYNSLRAVIITDYPLICQQQLLDILKESIISLEVPHNHIIFDSSLEKWCRQGVLPVSISLHRTESDRICNLLWNKLIKSLISKLSKSHTAIVYLLIGSLAQTVFPLINRKLNHVMGISDLKPGIDTVRKLNVVWKKAGSILRAINGTTIQWYQELI